LPATRSSLGTQSSQKIVATLCAPCHRISPDARDIRRHPPDLAAVADMRSTTEIALRVFLQTPHGNMPKYQLSESEIQLILNYVLSLKN
jgi:mono/diheme cytochrome c family protein